MGRVVVFLVAPTGWTGDGRRVGVDGASEGTQDGEGSGAGTQGGSDGASSVPRDASGPSINPHEPQVLERFIWDITPLSSIFPVPQGERHIPIARRSHPSEINHSAVSDQSHATSHSNERPEHLEEQHPDLTEQLRATLSALSSCGSRLKSVPVGCTPGFAVEMVDGPDVEVPIRGGRGWVPVAGGLQKTRGGDGSGGILNGTTDADKKPYKHRPSIVPLRSVDAGEFVFEMWIEEGAAKG